MNTRLPPVAILLGIAGLIPFIGCGIAASSTVEDQAILGLAGLIGYGAVILAFLGGVHWGFVLSPTAVAPRRDNLLLVLGVLPSLIGWAALMATPLVSQIAGLCVLIVGFVATMVTEWRLRGSAAMPTGYLWLRWGLSVAVLIVLIAVLSLRLLGARVVL